MPIIIDTLQNAVQSTLATFLQHRLSTNDDLHSDVYRTIRDVANLLLEKQLVCEAFDKDPFELMSRRHDLEDDEVGHDDGNSIGRGIGVGGSKQGNHGIGDDDNNDDIDDDALERKKNAELISRVKVSEATVSTHLIGESNQHLFIFITALTENLSHSSFSLPKSYFTPHTNAHSRPRSTLYHVHEFPPPMVTVPSTQ